MLHPPLEKLIFQTELAIFHAYCRREREIMQKLFARFSVVGQRRRRRFMLLEISRHHFLLVAFQSVNGDPVNYYPSGRVMTKCFFRVRADLPLTTSVFGDCQFRERYIALSRPTYLQLQINEEKNYKPFFFK